MSKTYKKRINSPKINVFRHNIREIKRNMFFFQILHFLPLNLVEELYCQNRNTTKLEIFYEERYSLQVGPRKKINVNNVVYQ